MNSPTPIISRSHSPTGWLLALLALLTFGAASLWAEDVYVTTYISTGVNTCGPSCPYGLGPSPHSFTHSDACQVSRAYSMFGIANTATWKVTPALANSHGTYKIFVTKGPANDCSPDIMVNMTNTGGTLSDANGTPQTTVSTSAFQRANSVNAWTLVGYLANNTKQPDVVFTYASGNPSRFYMDAVYFQSVDAITSNALPTRITQILYSNAVIIAGTGPVNHPFALVSSTNVAEALDQWTPEQTNTDGNGSFTFSITTGTAKARFFRVITQ
jgi:hypothetical protein